MTSSECTGQRAAVLARVASLIPVVARPLLVAVDGPDGVGKTWFADELGEGLRRAGRIVVRASADDFHHPREYRQRLGRDAHAVWTRHFDYRTMRRELLDPWLAGPGAVFRAAWHDVRRDEYAAAQPEPVPEGGVLVVDGVFAQRPELEHAWDLVVYLDAPPEVTVSRLAARDGSADDVDDPDQARYLAAQRLYLETCGPRQKADVVVDNTDLDRPGLEVEAAPPPGWARAGEELVRTLRLPHEAAETAALISRLADGA